MEGSRRFVRLVAVVALGLMSPAGCDGDEEKTARPDWSRAAGVSPNCADRTKDPAGGAAPEGRDHPVRHVWLTRMRENLALAARMA